MRITRKKLFTIILIPIIVVFIATSTGCAKKVEVPGTPQISTFERTVSTIKTINALTTASVLTLDQTGVIKHEVAASITNWNLAVSEGVNAVELIKAGTAPDEEKAAAIQRTVESLKLPTEVRAFIATPSSNKAISGIIAFIDFLRALLGLLVAPR